MKNLLWNKVWNWLQPRHGRQLPSRATSYYCPAPAALNSGGRAALLLSVHSVGAPVRTAPTTPEDTASATRWQEYHSMIELRRAWQRLDQPQGGTDLIVVLILDRGFCADLPSLIRRRHLAQRLVLVASSGRLPGLATIGDLSASSHALGWHSMACERDWRQAVRGVQASMAPGERAVIFSPRSIE